MEKLPEDWLFNTLNRIEKRMDEHGAEMRNGFQAIRQAQADHELDDAGWKAKVASLEQRQGERSTFAHSLHTTLITGGLVAVWEGVKHFAGWK